MHKLPKVNKSRVFTRVICFLQNFSAGILLAAVGKELFPLLDVEGGGIFTPIGMTIGFLVGLGLMFTLKTVLEDLEGEEEEEDDHAHGHGHGHGRKAKGKALEFSKVVRRFILCYNSVTSYVFV